MRAIRLIKEEVAEMKQSLTDSLIETNEPKTTEENRWRIRALRDVEDIIDQVEVICKQPTNEDS